TRAQTHLLLGIAQEDPESTLQDVERVGDVAVVVPGHLLGRTDLQLGDPKTRPLGMPGTTLHLVQIPRIFDRVHVVFHPVADYMGGLEGPPKPPGSETARRSRAAPRGSGRYVLDENACSASRVGGREL